MKRPRNKPKADLKMQVHGNPLHIASSTNHNYSQTTFDSRFESSNQPPAHPNPKVVLHTRAINYSNILANHETRQISNSHTKSHYRNKTLNFSATNKAEMPNEISPSQSTVNRLTRINRRLKNNATNISAANSAAPIVSLQTSQARLAQLQRQNRIQNQRQRQLQFELQLQQHQQNLYNQHQLIQQRQQQLREIEMNHLLSLMEMTDTIHRSRIERSNQMDRINSMSDEALSIINRIQNNLEQREDEDIFGIEYIYNDENDFGIDENMERIIEDGLYGNLHEEMEFDAEDENGNVIHVCKRKMKPNVPETHLEKRLITESEIAQHLECPICLSEFESGAIVSELKCGHMYHHDCIAPWVKKHPTCPVCRSSTV